MPSMHPAVQFVLVLATCLVIIVAIVRKVPISLRGGPLTVDVSLEQQMREIKTEVEKIGNAVNHTPPNQPPLVERVERVEVLAHWQADATHRIATHVGLELSGPPDRRNSTKPPP